MKWPSGAPSTHLGGFRNPDAAPIPFFLTVSEGEFSEVAKIHIQFTSSPTTLHPTANQIKGDTQSVCKERASSVGARHGGARRDMIGLCLRLRRGFLGSAVCRTRHREG